MQFFKIKKEENFVIGAFKLCKFSRIASVSMEILYNIIWINAMVEMNNTMHNAINALFENI